MSTLDIIILIVLTIGLIHGMRTGFVRQATTLAGILVAFVAAASLMGAAGNVLSDYVGLSPDLAPLVGFVAVFLLARLVIYAFGTALDELLTRTKLGGLNRLAGGVAGAFKAAVIMSILFLVFGFVRLPSAPIRAQSDLYEAVYGIVPDAWQFLSKQSPAFDDLRKQVEDRLGAGSGARPI